VIRAELLEYNIEKVRVRKLVVALIQVLTLQKTIGYLFYTFNYRKKIENLKARKAWIAFQIAFKFRN
jgi:hypothetical protein